MRMPALVLLLLVVATPFAAAAAVAPFDVPGAQFSIDPSGQLDFAQAQRLTYASPAAFVYPGIASISRPLVLWLRFPDPRGGPWYVVAASSVGRAELYAPGSSPAPFGMRVPYAQRSIQRPLPTVRVPESATGSMIYVRLALDDEKPIEPIATLMDDSALHAQDLAFQRLAATSLLFIGIFVSLAAANVFVFFFVREATYMIYSGMMLSNALFASTYLHLSAWQWFWPYASLPDAVVQGSLIAIEAVFLLAFARTFLGTPRLVPRADRIVTITCMVLLAAGLAIVLLAPSARFGPVTGRDVFIINSLIFIGAVFALGIAALRAGSITARFFVASNGAVSLAAASVAVTNFTQHDVLGSSNFIALMGGQAIEGWLLFGALAYRLRQTIGAHMEEQQQRLLAQAEMLAQAQALNETRRLAATDGLTGIPNRRMFDETLDREWYRCARAGAPVSVLILDVDFFKKYNDTYGHVAGDECLRSVAQAMASCMKRASDFCARYGGEEFAVILPGTPLDEALAIAESISNAVRDLRIAHAASATGYVSLSIGAATSMPGPETTKARLIGDADAALYRAKEAGRDRVEAFA